MSESLTPSEADAVTARLRAAATIADAPPEHVFDAARAAFGLRDLDTQLARLVSDSAEAGDAVLLRGVATEADYRTVVFEVGDVTIELEIAEAGGGRRLVGLVAGVAAGQVRVEYADGRVVSDDVDELGRFALDAPTGVARLRLVVDGADDVVTSFVTL